MALFSDDRYFYELMNKKQYEISFDDYLYEYASNCGFKEIIDSGNFVYAEERVVINDSQYVIISDGVLCLTDYAKGNEAECCLYFTSKISLRNEKASFINRIPPVPKRRIIFQKIGDVFGSVIEFLIDSLIIKILLVLSGIGAGIWCLFKFVSSPYNWIVLVIVAAIPIILIIISTLIFKFGDAMYSLPNLMMGNVKYCKLNHLRQYEVNPAFKETEQNIEVINRAVTLAEQLTAKTEFVSENIKNFSQLAWAYMGRNHCQYKESFRQRTLLSDKTFDRIKKERLLNPNIETVMAICIGLNLGTMFGEPLLKIAGYDLANSASPLHMLYNLLLSSCRDYDIFQCNAILISLNVKPLCEKEYLSYLAKHSQK